MPEATPHSRRERTAYHEAGHAVVAFMLRRSVLAISIAPDDDSRGRCSYARTDRKHLQKGVAAGPQTRRVVERLVMCTLGGTIAEQLLTGVPIKGRTDLTKAADLATYVTTTKRENEAYVAWLAVRTEVLLQQPHVWAAVEAVAQAVLSSNGSELSGARARRLATNAQARAQQARE